MFDALPCLDWSDFFTGMIFFLCKFCFQLLHMVFFYLGLNGAKPYTLNSSIDLHESCYPVGIDVVGVSQSCLCCALVPTSWADVRAGGLLSMPKHSCHSAGGGWNPGAVPTDSVYIRWLLVEFIKLLWWVPCFSFLSCTAFLRPSLGLVGKVLLRVQRGRSAWLLLGKRCLLFGVLGLPGHWEPHPFPLHNAVPSPKLFGTQPVERKSHPGGFSNKWRNLACFRYDLKLTLKCRWTWR